MWSLTEPGIPLPSILYDYRHTIIHIHIDVWIRNGDWRYERFARVSLPGAVYPLSSGPDDASVVLLRICHVHRSHAFIDFHYDF